MPADHAAWVAVESRKVSYCQAAACLAGVERFDAERQKMGAASFEDDRTTCAHLAESALDALGRYSETNLFLRAIVPQLGFQSAEVFYERHARLAGESKYNLTRMIALAINGVTSFSMKPLRFITVIGIAVALASFVVGLWAIGLVIFTSRAVPGWASVVAPLTFLGGLQLFSMGVIGEYIGKIYLEVKRRPLFEIERML